MRQEAQTLTGTGKGSESGSRGCRARHVLRLVFQISRNQRIVLDSLMLYKKNVRKGITFWKGDIT